MAVSIPYIKVTKGTWVNLNTASGIPAGTAVEIQNTSSTDTVDLVIKGSTPDGTEGALILSQLGRSGSSTNIAATESAIWAHSDSSSNCLLCVRAIG